MKKLQSQGIAPIIIILIIVGVLAIGGGVYYYSEIGKNKVNNQNINEQQKTEILKDAHGCLIKEGYLWCETENKCLKNTETCSIKKTVSSSTPVNVASTEQKTATVKKFTKPDELLNFLKLCLKNKDKESIMQLFAPDVLNNYRSFVENWFSSAANLEKAQKEFATLKPFTTGGFDDQEYHFKTKNSQGIEVDGEIVLRINDSGAALMGMLKEDYKPDLYWQIYRISYDYNADIKAFSDKCMASPRIYSATPEAAIKVLAEALKNGDIETAMRSISIDCFHDRDKEPAIRDFFLKSGKELSQSLETAEKNYAGDEYAEFHAVTKIGNENVLGTITLYKTYKGWIIDQF